MWFVTPNLYMKYYDFSFLHKIKILQQKVSILRKQNNFSVSISLWMGFWEVSCFTVTVQKVKSVKRGLT